MSQKKRCKKHKPKFNGRCSTCGEKIPGIEIQPSDIYPAAEVAFFTKLKTQKPKTKLQLMALGLNPKIIQSLVDCDILIQDKDPVTNLIVYKVSSDFK